VRIALACPYALDAPGGVQGHVVQLARHLRGRGHETLVLAPGWSRPEEPGVVVVGRPVRIRFNGSVAAIAPDPLTRWTIRRALTAFRPDVVHVHEPFSPSTGMFAAQVADAPVVATFHAYADRARVVTLAAPLLRRVWRRLAVRIAVSNAAAEFASRHFSGPVRIVPNGVDVELFAAATPATLPAGRRLLFVNRLEPRKGFDVAVRAFGMLAPEVPDLRMVVVGEGAEQRTIEQLPPSIRSRVLMLGRVPHAALAPYHAAVDLFVAPAVGGESFGIVLVEAMAAGLPVIASDIPGYREVVRDGIEGILIPPRDPPALAAAVRRLLDRPEEMARLGEAGRRRAERYSWTAVTREIEAAYQDAL
jgi:phosphatidyl-myo-inositol alpha-mannosyltransferase